MQTLAWFRDRNTDGTLALHPPYQRNPIWTAKQKCCLIESVLLSMPIPEIYVQQSTTADERTSYVVVDGQQRIRTVLQFVGAETEPAELEHNRFILDRLAPDSPWKNLAYADLEPAVKQRFLGYQFVVRYLESASETEIRDAFWRLNKYQSPLKPQELRNATYTGPFIKLSEQLADNEYWADSRILSPALIRRMTDVEFMSELLIGVMHGPQGGSPKVVDEYYDQLEEYEDEIPRQSEVRALFDVTLHVVQRILLNIKETRWHNKTDFYTLFVALAALLAKGDLPARNLSKVRSALLRFAGEVDRRLENAKVKVSKPAAKYVRAVEKGANDKLRRAVRHRSLVSVISGRFAARKTRA